jgi:hypothetical protein
MYFKLKKKDETREEEERYSEVRGEGREKSDVLDMIYSYCIIIVSYRPLSFLDTTQHDIKK